MKRSLVVLFLFMLLPAGRVKPLVVVTGQSNAVGTARALRAQLPGVIVINCAWDGSSILVWQRGQELYETCLSKVRSYQQGGHPVVWIFFMQGERDSYEPTIAPRWLSLFYRFAHDFRVDLKLAGTPIMYAQLGPLPMDRPRPYWRSIQSHQRLALQGHPGLRMIQTYDLVPYCPAPGPHWCEEGYTAIAQRAIQKYESAFGRDQRPSPAVQHVGIDHGIFDILVSEQFLDGADIISGFQ